MAIAKDLIQPKSICQISQLTKQATQAKQAFRRYTQEAVDKIVSAVALAAVEHHLILAKEAYLETEMGLFEDKVIKNLVGSEYVYNHIRDQKTVGVITEDNQLGITEIAEPIGVIAGIVPVTNPTSTTIFKTLISLKTRNPIIFSFHPRALKCSIATAKILYKAALEAGAPEGCIGWIEEPSIEATNQLLRHEAVDLILATGGAGMVQAAYSCGKPALGVGPGNVPAYIEMTADIAQAVHDIVLSKTFDNGTICASEQAVIVDQAIAAAVKAEFVKHQGYFLNESECKKLAKVAIDELRGSMNPAVVGQPAYKIAEMAGISVPEGTKILIAPQTGVGVKYPLSQEKLSPILAFYTVADSKEGIKLAIEITEFGGLGHSAAIHSNNQEVIAEFSHQLQCGRILVNSPSALGGVGDSYNYLPPSFTLGCGSNGRNSTTDNVGIRNLLNIKRQANRKIDERWFRVPPRIFFEPGSIRYLAQLHGERAVIVTDKMMVKLGYVEKATRWLEQANIEYRIFDEVEPDPSVETVENGLRLFNTFQPDIIIALGGGSPIDAAKGMWIFYEDPTATFEGLKLKFLDIRKRVYRFPELGKKAEFIAIPTTSGTGSEVTAFSVITDKKTGVKYPLADYSLTPEVAIIDPDFVMTVPQSVTADTGLDVLVHAIEAYVSTMASDYTDALALKAIELIFEYLPQAYDDGSNKLAREKVHNASCMAGMAFTNAFLGINHSMAHALGGKYHIAHGRANAILLPHVIKYNSGNPTKLAYYPKYNTYQAPERYRKIAAILGLPAATVDEGIASLIKQIYQLMEELNLPTTIQECGVDKKQFAKDVSSLAYQAFADQCTISNPRMPLVTELEELFWQAYDQKEFPN